jgi:phage head maturation protease
VPAAVIDHEADITDQEADLVRQALERLDDADRSCLWQALAVVDRMLMNGRDDNALDGAVVLAPARVRHIVAAVVDLRRRRRQQARQVLADEQDGPYLGGPKLTTIVGRAASHDTWTSNGWTWSSFAPEAFGDLATGRRRHSPVSVLYRHGGAPIGLTSSWSLSDDGDLDVECMLLPTARAQMVGKYAQAGVLGGLSVGTRPVDDSWCYVSPRQWEPRRGDLDLCTHRRTDIAEVSLTPTAAQSGIARVRGVW